MNPQDRSRLQAAAAVPPQPGAVRAAARRLRAERDADPLPLAAAFAHAGFAAPGAVAAIYDEAAEGWLGEPVGGPAVARSGERSPIPPAFWAAFWTLIEDAGGGMDALEITGRTAALGALLDPGFTAAAARAASAWPGVEAAAAQGWPAHFRLAVLAACPAGSLGRVFHDVIVDNGFDLEVLDREALGLRDLPPPLDYLNARILQAHDLWHIVGGYETTGLHEVGISGFQLAQFGHGYSAMFLAVATTGAAVRGQGASLLLDVILTAWAHGRSTPPLIGVRWEDLWSRSVDTVRAELGVRPYLSPYPADLFEQFVRAAA